MSEKSFKVFVGDNFKVEGQDVFNFNNSYLNRPGVYFDERAYFLTRNLDLSNWEWYYNYLDFTQTAANKNLNASANYLLDLGYIPIIYLPSCLTSLGSSLKEALDVKGIPYIHVTASSFVTKYCNMANVVDYWVSKMDVAKLLNVEPYEVTSKMVLRKLVICDE